MRCHYDIKGQEISQENENDSLVFQVERQKGTFEGFKGGEQKKMTKEYRKKVSKTKGRKLLTWK